jgi:hypothetical protein
MSNTNHRTIAETTIALSGLAPIAAAAAKNGMTANQMAAAQYIGSLASKLSPESKSILGNKDSALDALARIQAAILA